MVKTEFEIFVINKVKDLRLANGMTQSELAHRLDVSSGFIGKVESLVSNTKYNLNHINKIAKIFQVSPKLFFPDQSI